MKADRPTPGHQRRRLGAIQGRRRRAALWAAPESTPLECRALLTATIAAPIGAGSSDGSPTPAQVVYGPVAYQAPTVAADPVVAAASAAITPVGSRFPGPPGPYGYWSMSARQVIQHGGQMTDGMHGDQGGGGGGHPSGSGGHPGFPPGAGQVELAAAEFQVAGQSVREVAVADRDNGTISLSVGGNNFAYSNLVQDPEALAMADLNGDGSPDLVVAESGGAGQAGNVLVFPGLPAGGFSSTPQSYRVGVLPVGITVANFDGQVGDDGRPLPEGLIIADKGSNDVTMLMNQGQGADWSMTRGATIALPPSSRPVSTALRDINGDGSPDLFICDSGTGTVMLYQGLGGGRFDTSDPRTFDVGSDPEQVFVGRFDRSPGLDLVTVNAGSNDLTFVSGISGGTPTTTSITSGGVQPDAAFAVDLGQGGAMSLVVANGGDGRVALLQPGLDGLELAGVISQPDLPSVTSLASGGTADGGLDLFAATAGLDVAALLHFDLGTTSEFLAVPTGSAISAADTELEAQLTGVAGSPLDLVAVLWNGEGDDPATGGRPARDPALNATFYARTEGQGGDEGEAIAATSGENDPDNPTGPAPVVTEPNDRTAWLRHVQGLEEWRDDRDEPVDALAAADALEIRGDRLPVGLARRPVDPDAEAAAGAVDEALQSLWSGDSAAGSTARPGIDSDADGELDPRPGLVPAREVSRQDDARSPEVGSEMAPVASSTLIAARLLLKASPPRPPAVHKGGRRPSRFVAWPPRPS